MTQKRLYRGVRTVSQRSLVEPAAFGSADLKHRISPHVRAHTHARHTGALLGDFAHWRFAFLLGLLGGGLILSAYMPHAFDTIPDSYTVRMRDDTCEYIDA